MKACLICPSARPATAALAHNVPLANLPMLGKRLVEYWLEHLAEKGATDVRILAADRPEMVLQLVGTGARWGLNVEVVSESRELTPGLAQTKYPVTRSEWLPEPDDVALMSHFPGLPSHPLFDNYADWFSALFAWLPKAATMNRIGVHEVEPGVWVAMRARIADSARLQGPCWIGEGVRIGARTSIGPGTILENHVLLESDCDISNTVIGPSTLVGRFTVLKESLVWGGTVIDLETGSVAEVPDAFILSALDNPIIPVGATEWLRQAAGMLAGNNEDLQLLWKNRGVKLP